MKALEKYEDKRQEIIQEISSIKSMQKGTLNEQFLNVPQKNKEPALRGPYYILTKKENNKTISKRIKSADYEKTKDDVDNYKRFMQLADEYVKIVEEMTSVKSRFLSEDGKKTSEPAFL